MAVCTFTYSLSLTGDCSNIGIGGFTINVVGSNPPFYYKQVSPTPGPLTSFGVGNTSISFTNLTSNVYTVEIFDSCGGSPNSYVINAIISDGVCSSIFAHQNTTCGADNGIITAATDNNLTNTIYYLYENSSGYITSGITSQDVLPFPNLSAGTYYIIVNDGGGCTGRSESCIIKDSTPFTYGFYIVNSSGCNSVSNGKIYITGLTGYEPYTYSWSNGQTTKDITGLTPNTYTVTVTDSTGCQVVDSATVSLVPTIGIGQVIPTAPSCYSNDGQITIVTTGGTAPFSYVGSNGQTLITFDETFSLTGLSAGIYTITVTDSALCTTTTSQTLVTPNGFTVVNVGVNGSTCNNTSGSLNPISIVGGQPPFVYTLVSPSGNSNQITSNSSTFSFTNLSAGTYTLTISNGGPCIFTNTYTINNVEKYSVSNSITGSTCDLNNGSVRLILSSGGTSPYTYQLTGQPTISNSSQTAVTFNNLFAGTYQYTVSDFTNCTQTGTILIPDTPSIDFVLSTTNASNINNGQINVYITSGPPPYTINWSNNVNGQTGLTLTNLSAGTYSVTIIDDNGCQLTRETTIYGFNIVGSYGVHDYCDSIIEYNGVTITKKIPQMYTEGYNDLVTGEENCILNGAVFYSVVTIGSSSAETPFYTSTSLSDYPSDGEWFDAVREALLSFSIIGNVIISPSQNRITIQTNCSELSLTLDNTDVSVSLKIQYDISCVCNIPPVPGPVFNTCDMIYIQPSNQVYYYEFSSDTSTLLTVNSYNFDSQTVNFTSSKLWLTSLGTNYTTIREWNVNLNGFVATFNRDLPVNFEIGNAVGVRSNTKLVTTNTSTQSAINYVGIPSVVDYVDYFVELNITNNTPVVTNKSNLSPNKHITGNIVFSNNYNQMISLQYDDSAAPFLTYYLCVHDTNNYNQIIEAPLTLVGGNPSGIFVNQGTLYLVDDTSTIYEIDSNYPYNQTYYGIVGGAGSIISLFQNTECFNQELETPTISCNQTVSLTNANCSEDGIFETYVNVGNNTGNVTVTFTTIGSDSTTPYRYQIFWNGNIVADSLFVYDTFGPNTGNNITGTTTASNFVDKYIYFQGNGNTTCAYPLADWVYNGIQVGKSYGNSSVIANSSLTRSQGTPGQIGVVSTYPTPASASSNPDLQLQFTKFLASPSIIKVVCYTRQTAGFTFEVTQCP